MKPIVHLKLKELVPETHFGMSERKMYHSLPKTTRQNLRTREAIGFISRGRNQMVLVWKVSEVGEIVSYKGGRRRARKQDATASVRVRLNGGHFNYMMLQNYANEAGIILDGLPRFEDYF